MNDEIMTTKHCVIYHFDLIKLIYLIIKAQVVETSVHHHLINMI